MSEESKKSTDLSPRPPRPTWDEYFMEFARLARTRSTCLRRGVGAVLVKEKNILATGYNGAPRDVPHCSEVGCLREQKGVPSGQMHELCRGLHAEQNAIIQAAYHGVSIRDADVYSTTFPCVICSKMLINAGVKTIYYSEGYPDDLSRDLLVQAGVKLVHLPK